MGKRTIAMVIPWVMALLIVFGVAQRDAVPVQAVGFNNEVAGVYFLQQSSGSNRLLTIMPDGIMLGTDSSQPASLLVPNSASFSNQQGVWEQTDFRKLHGKMFDFVYPIEANPQVETTMAIYDLTFSNDYRTVTGTITLQFYVGNPLAPGATPTGAPIMVTVMGQRATAQ